MEAAGRERWREALIAGIAALLGAAATVAIDRWAREKPQVHFFYGGEMNPDVMRQSDGSVAVTVHPSKDAPSAVAPYPIGPFWVMNTGEAPTASRVTVYLECDPAFSVRRDLSPGNPFWVPLESSSSTLRCSLPLEPLRPGDHPVQLPGFFVGMERTEYRCRLSAVTGEAKPATKDIVFRAAK